MVSAYAKTKLATLGSFVIKVIGIVLFIIGFFFVITVIANLTGDNAAGYTSNTVFSGVVVYVAPGAILYGWQRSITLRKNRYKGYIELFPEEQTLIDPLVKQIERSYETITRELNEMIAEGLFPGAYVDHASRSFVRSFAAEAEVSGEALPRVQPVEEKIEAVLVECPNCGARKTLVSKQAPCDYCGSLLTDAHACADQEQDQPL